MSKQKYRFTLQLADAVIGVAANHPQTAAFCKEYCTAAPATVNVEITEKDIALEREKSAREDALEKIPIRQFSDAYLETLAVYRKIAALLLPQNVLLFHGSAIAVEGQAYLFTAKSGTGKSTHTALWRQLLGPRAVMVNDDKPLLKITPTGVTVYGTPWSGKHNLSTNTAVPLAGLCILTRAATNHIEKITPAAAYPMLVQQSYRPQTPQPMAQTLALVDALAAAVPLYRLGCNTSPEAARVAFAGMTGYNIGKEIAP